ncbi:MAG: hypothetical protein N2689_05535 [Verrucomicrobiae bacterium]|nr:hypothetical protein [Verrucomicrobiae bacterium]
MLGAAALWLASLAPAGAAESKRDNVGAYKLADGPCAVEIVKDIVLRDAKRNKDLPVHLTFPRADGKFPIIVFSHGAGGSGDTVLAGLPKFWSSHGYICLVPTHADSIKLRRQQGERDASMMDVATRALSRKEEWENRPRDITFLLDSLDELEKKVPALRGRLDRSRIGVGGHSFGAFTAQVVGGATLDIAGDGKPKSLADPRVKAVLQLSGQGRGQMGLHEHSWKAMNLPMMCVTGSLDRGAQGQDPSWRKEPFDRSPPSDKYFVFIEGAHHLSFTGPLWTESGRGGLLAGRFGRGRAGSGDAKAIFEWVKSATIAFWDASLRQDRQARTWLQSDSISQVSQRKARLERR